MKRRTVLKGAMMMGAGAATAGLARPAIAQERFKWTMVAPWPIELPGLGTSTERFAERVERMSEGRLQIRLYGAGELVPPFESFDAVTTGTAQIMHDAAYYWQGNHPGINFFTSAPYGMLAGEHNAWITYGGGQKLWDELYDEFGLKAWLGGDTGTQMAGWFPQEIESVDDLGGLSFRTAGLGGEVWRRLGLNVQTLSGGEIFLALESGVLDAAEWVGPWNDMALGLHQLRRYYYYPSIIEPGGALAFTVNKSAYEELPGDLQEIVHVAANAEHNLMRADFDANNLQALDRLVNEHDVVLKRFPDEVIDALAQASAEVVAETADYDDMTRRIVDSMIKFREAARRWTAASEQSFAASRDRDIQYPA